MNMINRTVDITFHGVRGSWPQSGPHFTLGGHTLCVEAVIHDQKKIHTLLFDAGTGMTRFSQSNDVPKEIHLFLSHYHMDHIIGLTLLEQLFNQSTHLIIHAPILENRSPKEIFESLIRPPFYPFNFDFIAPSITFSPFRVGETLHIDNILIHTLLLDHPGSSCGYRIHADGKNFCYITDVGIAENDQFYPNELINFVQNTDLLIQDTYFNHEDFKKFKHFGHGAYHLVPELAKKAHVKELYLYHHNPHYTDNYLKEMEKLAQSIFSHSYLGYEGLKVSL